MKKIVFTTIIVILLGGTNIKAQEIFFPTEEGVELLYNCYDKKGKLNNLVRYTVTDVTEKEDNLQIKYLSEVLSPKMKVQRKNERTVWTKDDSSYSYFDMIILLSKNSSKEYMGVLMPMPLEPKIGDKLMDSDMTTASMTGVTFLIKTFDRKIEAIEEISVEAGTFNCYKISMSVEAPGIGIKGKLQMYYWYAAGIGFVKVESYENEKIYSRMELIEVKSE